MSTDRSLWALLAVLGLACHPAPTTAPTPEPVVAAAPFENPGGMWMPVQLGEHAETLRGLGVEFDPAALTDPTAFPLGAIVGLGGCSASFVSAEGLIVTNHHCVTGALQNNSTPERNLLQEGYVARTRADELPAGPTARVYVTIAFNDVTEDITKGLDEITDDRTRAQEIDTRSRARQQACEARKPGHSCEVDSFFEGAQYFEIERLEIRDVRLVYAPHQGVGVFGGEVDNWRWPRHTGDFAFLRAYVGSDGQPAGPAATNVPYAPKHSLQVATEPLEPGDFAMVAGYPGRTYRLKTAAEVEEAVTWQYPRDIARFEQAIALYKAMGAKRPELLIKSAQRLRGLENYRTNYEGMLDGLTKGGLLERKRGLERDLAAWIDGEPTRKQAYGDVLPALAQLVADHAATRDHDASVEELGRASIAGQLAQLVAQIAGERSRPAAERSPELDGRVLEEARGEAASLLARFDPELDAAVLGLAVQRAAALPDGQRPDSALYALLGEGHAAITADPAKLSRALTKMFTKTKLADAAVVDELLRSATTKSLEKRKDPVLAAYARMTPVGEEVVGRARAQAGAMARLRPRYVRALREYTPTPIAPDANGTLRISYGTVKGYRPTKDADLYVPFSTVSQMVAKNTGHDPFAAPAVVMEAIKTGDFGPYRDAALGDLPLDFLADLDITGGNSGSATLNGKGQLIGLAFDGNYEAIASDWVFMPEVSRSIHVDIRYTLWLMDKVDGADHLLREMGVEPALTDAPAPSVAVGRSSAAAAGAP